MNQKQLIIEANLSERTVRNALNSLRNQGFIDERHSLDDIRYKNYFLTERGEGLCQ